jgi:hypothetical protein
MANEVCLRLTLVLGLLYYGANSIDILNSVSPLWRKPRRS